MIDIDREPDRPRATAPPPGSVVINGQRWVQPGHLADALGVPLEAIHEAARRGLLPWRWSRGLTDAQVLECVLSGPAWRRLLADVLAELAALAELPPPPPEPPPPPPQRRGRRRLGRAPALD